MKNLAELVSGLAGLRLRGPSHVIVRGVVDDSRAVGPGCLFAALPGATTDGRRFIGEALARGASAVLGPAPGGEALPGGVPYLEAEAPRQTLAELCRRFYDAPDEQLALVGVTGTNGKTTTAHLLAAALAPGGKMAAVGGTVGQKAGSFREPARLTTPEAPALYAFLQRAVDAGCQAAVIEVSSAALVADRVHGLHFAGAVLTGIGRDHLDLHGDFESYVRAKQRLFQMLDAEAFAVLPVDDPQFAAFRAVTKARVITFGETPEAVWRIADHRPDSGGAELLLEGPGGPHRLRTLRPGPWDARNIAAAAAGATALGVDPRRAAEAAAAAPSVEGRWELVDRGQPFLALVDYAHTPEALDRTLAFLRRITAGRVILVFGCGGERDRGKRAEMGRAAGRWADLAIVTDDNPRREDPEQIAREILAGLEGAKARVERLSDRSEAIRRAVREARPKDAVLVAGKGHETYQEIGGVRRHFDDREQLALALAGSEARS